MIMLTLTKQKKDSTSNLSVEQKNFNRLRKRVEKLHLLIKSTQEELDECLSFYYKVLIPEQQNLFIYLTESTKLIYIHYKTLPTLTKKDKKILKEILSHKVREILSKKSPCEADPEVCAIFKDIVGVDFQELALLEMNNFKKNIEEKFKKEGVDIDLSNIDDNHYEFEIRSKISEALSEFREKMEEQQSKSQPKQKSKRELEKEKKAQELENVQKKGLSTIYKQLAKVVHPDLEQDPAKKSEKEVLMKRLTHAYDNNDLHALLALEIEWMNRSENDVTKNAQQSNEQLKIFNSLLKKQTESLEEELSMVCMNPKYFSIQDYLIDDFYTPIFQMQIDLRQAQSSLKEYREVAKKLLSKDPLKTLRAICAAAI
ncbi:MAG: hypothetical protein H0X29_10575 [Parachlamydiaceae bacterium]|nr:hypothetical protein [Parachlamydiaceae bacterium]